MIRLVVAAVLVAGTFGIVWTAPWKDDADRLTDQVSRRLGATWATIGLRADRNVCDAVTRPPEPDEVAAVAFVIAELRAHPNARLLQDGGSRAVTVRDVASQRSRDIAGCLSTASVRGAGWVDLQRRLGAGLAAAGPG